MQPPDQTSSSPQQNGQLDLKNSSPPNPNQKGNGNQLEIQINQNNGSNMLNNQSQIPVQSNGFNRSYVSRNTIKMDQLNASQQFELIDQELSTFRKKGCSCCSTSMGSHAFLCGTNKVKNDGLIKFGIGINLYFRFLKQMGICFLLFSILAIPQVVLSILSYQQSGQEIQLNINSILMATTIGSIGLNNKVCSILSFDTESSKVDLELSCRNGYIDFNNSFVFGLVESNEQNCIYINSRDLYANAIKLDSINDANCKEKQNCSFSLSQDNFNKNVSQQRVFAKANCKNATIEITPFYQLQQKYVPVILTSIDILIILLFIYFLIILNMNENEYQEQSKIIQPLLEYFSIQVSKIPDQGSLNNIIKNVNSQIFLENLKKYIDKSKDGGAIYDIQSSESSYLQELFKDYTHQQKLLQIQLTNIKKLTTQINKEFLNNDSVEQIDKNTYDQEFKILMKSLPENHKERHSLNKANEIINKIWTKIEDLDMKINKEQNNITMKYVWITFQTMRQKQKVEEQFQSLPIDWLKYHCCFCCMGDDYKKELFQQKFKLQIKSAPNPDNIIWANLESSSKNRLFRRLLSGLITIAILCGSFYFITYINQSKKDFEQKYPSINCDLANYQNITPIKVNLELNGESTVRGYVECYCKPKFEQLMQNSLDAETTDICKIWLQDYIIQQGLPWAIVGGLIFVNVILQYIFIWLSKCESHQILSEEYASRIFKIFLAQFLNTGLILLITNTDFGISNDSSIPYYLRFLFGGKYADIDPQWCYNVGVILLLTLLINVLTSPVILLFEQLIILMIKIYDQCSCCLNRKSSKKLKNIAEFRELYLGEEFKVDLRYAQILNAIYVCMMYSAALPFLYFTSFLTITFLYWVDKLLLFTTYRKPIILDMALTIVVKRLLWLLVIIHIGFAIYIYGSTNLFYETLQDINLQIINTYYNQQSLFTEWLERASKSSQNIILAAILILVLLIFIIMFFLYTPAKQCLSFFLRGCNNRFKLINRQERYTLLENTRDTQFVKFLSQEQIQEDLKFTKYQETYLGQIYEMKKLILAEELKIPMNRFVSQIKNIPMSESRLIPPNQIVQQQNEEQVIELQEQKQENRQKLIGLSCYNMAYNPNYRQYFPWNDIKC